jgi:hypothetical protein
MAIVPLWSSKMASLGNTMSQQVILQLFLKYSNILHHKKLTLYNPNQNE